MILCISMQWFREWESFVKGKDNGMSLHLLPTRHCNSKLLYIKEKLFSYIVFSEPPGHIDNSKIGVVKGGHIQLKQGEPQRWW